MLFVCYSSLDEQVVMSMVADLRGAYYEVWIDEKLHGGQPWWQEILHQIRDCEVFLFALSENSLKSKPCRAELAYARDLGLPILPIQIGRIESPHTLPVADLQIVDYLDREVAAKLELVSSVNASAARRRPLPASLPPDPAVPYAFLAGIATDLSADALSYQQQSEIIDRLDVGLDEEDSTVRPEILGLLDVLSHRRDLYFTHAERIAAIRRRSEGAGPSPAPPAETPPEPPVDLGPPLEAQPTTGRRRVVWLGAGAAALVAAVVGAVVLAPSLWSPSAPEPSASDTSAAQTATGTPSATPTPSVTPVTVSTGLIPQSDAIPNTTLAVTREVDGVADVFLVDSVTGEVGKKVTVGGSPVAQTHDPPWPAISPDRRSIVYVVQTSLAESSLRVMAADGSADRNLFDAKVCDRYLPPAWDPVRQDRLAIACLRQGRFALFLINLDGSNDTEFPTANAWIDDVSFSPDGRSLAYFSGTAGDPGGSIFTVRVDGPFDPVNLTHSIFDRRPVWNEDGSEIAFERGDPAAKRRAITVMSADGSNLRTIGPPGADNIEPTWSPDGEWIAFRSNAGSDDPDRYRFMLMDSTGGNIRPLSDADAAPAAAAPAWGRR